MILFGLPPVLARDYLRYAILSAIPQTAAYLALAAGSLVFISAVVLGVVG